MNKNNENNENNEITPKKTLRLLNKAFIIILNQNNYHYIDLDTKKSLYDGFYAGFNLLMKLSDLPDNIKYHLIAKKQLVDSQYTKNFANTKFKLYFLKNKANQKNTENLKKETNEYLNKKAKKLENLNALILKKKVTELSSNEKKFLNAQIIKKLLN